MTRFHYLLLALVIAGCGGDDEPAADADTSPDARPPRGTMSLSWTVTEGGDPGTCPAGSQVVLSFVRQGELAGDNAVINCSAGDGVTQEISVGTYDVDIDLIGTDLQSLLESVKQQNGVEVTEGDETALDPVVFDL